MSTPAPTLLTRWQTARIGEAQCIGCFRCVPVCPEAAILGAARHTHTVIQSLCTGCAHCLEACPVDCITLHPTAHLCAPVALGVPA